MWLFAMEKIFNDDKIITHRRLHSNNVSQPRRNIFKIIADRAYYIRKLYSLMILTPEISVIIPVFNPGKYINQICDSFCQFKLFKNYEIMVVDDDHSKEFCDLKKYDLKLFSVDLKIEGCFSQNSFQDSGPAAARNLGLRILLQPQKITFFDCDDYWHSSYLGQYVNRDR